MAVARKGLALDRSGTACYRAFDDEFEQGIAESVLSRHLGDPDLIDADDAVGPEDADEVSDHDLVDVRNDDIDAFSGASIGPVPSDSGVLDQPALTTALADQGSASVAFEQLELGDVVAVARIERPNRRIDHDSSSCDNLPRMVRR